MDKLAATVMFVWVVDCGGAPFQVDPTPEPEAGPSSLTSGSSSGSGSTGSSGGAGDDDAEAPGPTTGSTILAGESVLDDGGCLFAYGPWEGSCDAGAPVLERSVTITLLDGGSVSFVPGQGSGKLAAALTGCGTEPANAEICPGWVCIQGSCYYQ